MEALGFIRVAKDVYHYVPQACKEKTNGPDYIVLFTWLGADTRNIAKYTNGYKQLFPSSQIVLTRSTFSSILASPSSAAKHARSTIDAIYKYSGNQRSTPSILVHAWSNGGAYQLQSTCRAYHYRFNAPLAPSLVVLDSTPGSASARGTLRTSVELMRTMLPKTWVMRAASYGYAALFMFVLFVLPRLRGDGATLPDVMRRALNDDELLAADAVRMYFYSDGDALIDSRAVEDHAKEAVDKGYDCELVHFEDSQHVAHVKKYPDRYWGAIFNKWNKLRGK